MQIATVNSYRDAEVSLRKDGASGHFKKLNKAILIPRVSLALLLALLVAAPALAAHAYRGQRLS